MCPNTRISSMSLKRPSRSHCLAHIASVTVAALSEPRRSVQRCLDFEKSLSTETTRTWNGKKSQAMREMIGKSRSWSCQTKQWVMMITNKQNENTPLTTSTDHAAFPEPPCIITKHVCWGSRQDQSLRVPKYLNSSLIFSHNEPCRSASKQQALVSEFVLSF